MWPPATNYWENAVLPIRLIDGEVTGRNNAERNKEKKEEERKENDLPLCV